MELLYGHDLESLVRNFGPLPPARVMYLICQVCRSLGEAHAMGLIHRDIKPANIYLCRMGLEYDFAKVLDFGIVKRERRDGATTMVTAEPGVDPTRARGADAAIASNRAADPARSRRIRPGLSAQGSEAPARQRRRIAADGQHLQDGGPLGPAGGSKMVGSASSTPCDAGEGPHVNLGRQRALRPNRKGASADTWAYDSAR